MGAKEKGYFCAALGYSLHYNEFRHKAVEDYLNWELGWFSFWEEAKNGK